MDPSEPVSSSDLSTTLIVIANLAAVVLGLFFWFFAGRMYDGIAARVARLKAGLMPDRRRMLKSAAMKVEAEKRFDAMDDETLAIHQQSHPGDALASEILSDRLLKARRWADYARLSEHLLSIPNGLTKEEACNRYNRLADLYLGRLAQPEKGREMLQKLIERFPQQYQATLARRRLEAMGKTGRRRSDY